MIAIEAHVYAYYLHKSKGIMTEACKMSGLTWITFTRKARRYGLNYRKFRGPMCSGVHEAGKRCKVCADKNRDKARERYHARKGRPSVPTRETLERTQRMMVLSAQMSQLQRFMQLSK